MVKRKRKTKTPRAHYSAEDKRIIANYQGQVGIFGIICKRCKREFPMDIMQVDHIFPVSSGGKGRPSQLQLLCPTCNRKKGAKRPSKKRKQQPYGDVKFPEIKFPKVKMPFE